MLATLRERLRALSHALGIQILLRDRAVRRMNARHEEQLEHEEVLERLQDEADVLWKRARSLRAGGHLDRAEEARRKAVRKDKAAQKRKVRRDRAEAKAIVWKQRARDKTKLIRGIHEDIEAVQKEMAKLGPTVSLEDGKVTGGTFRERWVLSNLTAVTCCNNGRRRNAYSQGGTPDIWHPFGPGPAAGRRDDCSSYTTSQALATGADDPNGEDFSGWGFTGTLVGAHGRWRQVTLAEMVRAGQGYIIYGSGSGHHVECYCPSESDRYRTVGHGSAPVDFGTVHLFGAGEAERYFVFVTED